MGGEKKETSFVSPQAEESGMFKKINAKHTKKLKHPMKMIGFLPQITDFGPNQPKTVPPEKKKIHVVTYIIKFHN